MNVPVFLIGILYVHAGWEAVVYTCALIPTWYHATDTVSQFVLNKLYKGVHLCCPGTLDNVLQISLLLLESLNLQQVKLDREGAGNFHWEAVVLIFTQVLALWSSCCVCIWHWTDFAIPHSSKWYGRRQKLVILGPMLCCEVQPPSHQTTWWRINNFVELTTLSSISAQVVNLSRFLGPAGVHLAFLPHCEVRCALLDKGTMGYFQLRSGDFSKFGWSTT